MKLVFKDAVVVNDEEIELEDDWDVADEMDEELLNNKALYF